MGNLNALIYTVTLGRLTGGTGDGYDPMSDTLIFYSDNLDVTLREAGLAVDHDKRSKQGFGTGLYHCWDVICFPIALFSRGASSGGARCLNLPKLTVMQKVLKMPML